MSILKSTYASKNIMWWPDLGFDMIKYCNAYVVCFQSKPGGLQVEQASTMIPLYPFDCLVLDLACPGSPTTRGNAYIMTVMDVVSRYAFFVPVKSRQARHLADRLHQYVF